RPIRQPQVRPDLCANSRPFLDNDAEARVCAEGDVLFGHGYFFFWVACGTRRAPPVPVPWPVPDLASAPFGVKPYSTAGIVDIVRRPFFGTSLSASFILFSFTVIRVQPYVHQIPCGQSRYGQYRAHQPHVAHGVAHPSRE